MAPTRRQNKKVLQSSNEILHHSSNSGNFILKLSLLCSQISVGTGRDNEIIRLSLVCAVSQTNPVPVVHERKQLCSKNSDVRCGPRIGPIQTDWTSGPRWNRHLIFECRFFFCNQSKGHFASMRWWGEPRHIQWHQQGWEHSQHCGLSKFKKEQKRGKRNFILYSITNNKTNKQQNKQNTKQTKHTQREEKRGRKGIQHNKHSTHTKETTK